MKFRAERDSLVEALGTAARAAATRGGALPALSGVRMEVVGDTLKLAGSDLDLTVQVEATVNGVADGVCVIPARLAADIVRAVEPSAVLVSAEGSEAVISAGRSQFTVRLLPAEEFLRLPEPAAEAVTLDAATFSAALTQVVRAASRDDARPILTGVLLAAEAGGLRLVATDSYRLAMRDLPGTSLLAEGKQVLVPARALGELTRVLGASPTVTLRLGADHATFEAGNVRLTTRLIEGEFPNYRQLIPTAYPNRLFVGKEPLIDAVRRVKLLAREATPGAPRPAGRRGAAHRHHPGRGPGPGGRRRQVRGHGDDRRLQPRLPPGGHRGHPRRRGGAGDARRPEARHPQAHRGHRLPLPVDAGAGFLRRRRPCA